MSEGPDFVDPYVYPGTQVLINRAGITDPIKADEHERRSTLARRRELDTAPIEGSFDLAHLKAIHRALYQDVWDWAGETRTVNIAKGSSHFHEHTAIETAFVVINGFLKRSSLLNPDVDDETFVAECADLLEKINYVHPFREGNGRTQRAYLDQIAAISGRTLSWRNVSRADNERASIKAFNLASGEPLRSVIREALEPPMDGLSLADESLYTVHSQPVDPGRRRQTYQDRLAELSSYTATLRSPGDDHALER